jgi:DNA polymerase-3 subunit epsilon
MLGAFLKERSKKYLKDERFASLFDKNIPEDEFVVFDTETTGLDKKRDSIVSIGAVKVKQNKILSNEALHIFIKQNCLINTESIKIHKIRNCDLKEAVDIQDAMEEFLFFIGNRTLVGYYLEFDIAMIDKYIKPLFGVKLPNKQIEVSAMYYDKKIKFIPQGNIDLRFDTILKNLCLPKLNSHDALNDAIMTAMMYLKLKNIEKIK